MSIILSYIDILFNKQQEMFLMFSLYQKTEIFVHQKDIFRNIFELYIISHTIKSFLYALFMYTLLQ